MHSETAPDDRQFRPFFPEPKEDDASSHAYRQLIGVLGMLLPPALWLVAGLRPTKSLPSWERLTSISAYYYTGAVPVFVGILVALGIFLVTYRGYRNNYQQRDRIASFLAGIAAILVASFPTRAPAAASAPDWWTPLADRIHFTSALALFVSFIVFALYLFPKSKPDVQGSGQSALGAAQDAQRSGPTNSYSLPRAKQLRNLIYRGCGLAMVVCILWAGISELSARREGSADIFWQETLALEFFGISWLTKGHADVTAAALGQRALHYGRHPRQFATLVRKGLVERVKKV